MIFNFGSINIDHVYQVAAMPQLGETISAQGYQRFLGGKGINQSIAAHRAGGKVRHIGAVGADGDWVLEQIKNMGLSMEAINTVSAETGNAVITVDANGENQIIINSGANMEFTAGMIERALKDAGPKDWVVLQNETNRVLEIAEIARDKGAQVVYSAAPFDEEAALPMLTKIDLLAVNETEAADLTRALGKPLELVGFDGLLVTKGAAGADLTYEGQNYAQKAFSVEATDTTGAGDTFIGSLIGRLDQGDDPADAMLYAASASALQVTRAGAAAAIPLKGEVELLIQDALG